MAQSKKWICTVCGYVVEGENAPDSCPVCGASSEYFKEDDSNEEADIPDNIIGWRCLICGYETKDKVESCPICAATADQFMPLVDNSGNEKQSVNNDSVIAIIGSGIAALSAIQAIREQGDSSRIVMITKDSVLPYYRLNLTRYLAGEISNDQLEIKDRKWFEKYKIDLQLSTEAIKIDPESKKVLLSNDGELQYQKLVLATGAHPFIPPFKNSNKKNLSVIRTIDDVDLLRLQFGKSKTFAIIGGGILGLETAGALAKQGEDVILLEGYKWLLPRQLNKKAADLLQYIAEEKGIRFRKDIQVSAFIGDENAKGVILNNGDEIKADYFIITTGVRSNTNLAISAGLEVNRGVVVNDMMQTSNPDIYAVGDICEHRGVQYGTWGPAQFQGVIGGRNSIGSSIKFAGIPRTNMLKVLDVSMYSIGEISSNDASFEEVEFNENGNYYYFNVKDEKLRGAILLGDASISSEVTRVVENGINCTILTERDITLVKVLKFFRSV